MKNGSTYVLGINAAYHEFSACLLRDGELCAAVEEERFSRVKHGKIPLVDNADALPDAAIAYCLKSAEISLDDVDHFGYSFAPKARLQKTKIELDTPEGDFGSVTGEQVFHDSASSQGWRVQWDRGPPRQYPEAS